MYPFPIVELPVPPLIEALAVRLALSELALVDVAVGEHLVAPALPLVHIPVALVDPPPVLVDNHALPVPLVVLVDLPPEDRVLEPLHSKVVRMLQQVLVVKLVTQHRVVHVCLAEPR